MTDNLPEKKKENALTTIVFGDNGFKLTNLDEVFRYAQFVHRAGMAPKSLNSPEKIVIAIQTGAEVGLTPQFSLKNIAVIHNAPCMWGDALVALVRSSGKCEWMKDWIEGEGDERIAYCEGKRFDSTEPMIRAFSVQDAKDADLWGQGNWKLYGSRRLGMKPITWLMRDLFSDVLMGVSVRDEVEDYAKTEPTKIVIAPVKCLAESHSIEPMKVESEPGTNIDPPPFKTISAEPPVIDAVIEPSRTPEPSEDAQPAEDSEPAEGDDGGMTDAEAEAIRLQEIKESKGE